MTKQRIEFPKLPRREFYLYLLYCIALLAFWTYSIIKDSTSKFYPKIKLIIKK